MNELMTNWMPAIMLAQTPAGEAQPPMWVNFMPFIILLVMFYFLLIRPQQKKMKEHRAMVDALKAGDQVVAAGGIHGTVTNVKDTVVVLKVAEQVKLQVDKASVTTVKADS
jgi:preprotein translocase subunit YajC